MDWLGWFVPRFGRRTLPPESLAPPIDDDLSLLAELRAEGSKLHLAHPVRAFVRFEAEADARSAMEMLDKDGYRTHLRSDAEGRWTVTAIQSMIPTPGAITKMRENLTALAKNMGGEYLGWQAPPVY
jgi:hypothetical protein